MALNLSQKCHMCHTLLEKFTRVIYFITDRSVKLQTEFILRFIRTFMSQYHQILLTRVVQQQALKIASPIFFISEKSFFSNFVFNLASDSITPLTYAFLEPLKCHKTRE